MTYYAHSAKRAEKWEPLAKHLRNVSKRAAEYARAFGAEEEAGLAGLLHDLGKYGDLFQRRLRGEIHGIDHWSAGAWQALRKYKKRGAALALAIQGHHLGLQKGDGDSLGELNPSTHAGQWKLSEPDTNLLIARLHADGFGLPELDCSIAGWGRPDTVAAMLDVRMLFSALVDADYLETEAYFAAHPDGTLGYREAPPTLKPEKALEVLHRHLERLQKRSNASENVMHLRGDLLASCVKAADAKQGVFTLSAPTGAGKTLSMLSFALRHAVRHGLRRIIMVIPYLTIIEQTAGIYRDIFSPHFGEHYVLEHHSLAGTRGKDPPSSTSDADAESDSARTARQMAENWDAPIVVTTNVQLLQSLFANRPSACRKLHNLARSVVLLDEVQTLPARLAVPTLATLARLSERYNATVVFATATQPAFSHLDQETRTIGSVGWQPGEIVPPTLNLFSRARRTTVKWPDLDHRVPWHEIARQLAEEKQALCVVNLKRNALELAKMLKDQDVPGLFHLSTNMCPVHREDTLAKVRGQLKKGAPCRLISTQCIEAGVDVDFPVAYRAWGPLEAIAQVAGRCNREGKQKTGEVHVFLPQDAAYPSGDYEQAADVTTMLLKHRGPQNMDIHNPDLFEEYYRSLYDLAKIAGMPHGKAKELKEAIQRRDFADVAQLYQIIDRDAINILVPFDTAAYQDLADEVRHSGLNGKWIRKARPHSVSIFQPKEDAVIRNYLDPVPLTWRERSDEWFIYLAARHYHRGLLGLVPPQDFDEII